MQPMNIGKDLPMILVWEFHSEHVICFEGASVFVLIGTNLTYNRGEVSCVSVQQRVVDAKAFAMRTDDQVQQETSKGVYRSVRFYWSRVWLTYS